MGSKSAESVPARRVDLVETAASLRWARPDITAALADHVLEETAASGDTEQWLVAAGWAVHARAAIGDGREIACDVLDALTGWDGPALAGTAARRLRVELATVAASAGESAVARQLLEPVVIADGDRELLADVLSVYARCAVEDAPSDVPEALEAAAAAWNAVTGPAAEIGQASVALVRAVVTRRTGNAAAAVDHAADGLSRLERCRAGEGSPSRHIGAALAAEWISALLEADRAAEAYDGCSALLPRLAERARPTRQIALLWLTVARTVAAADATTDTIDLLQQAAEDAAGCDVPDLESACRAALAALHDKAGHADEAMTALQLGLAAERRDRERSVRLRSALAAIPADRPAAGAAKPDGVRRTNGSAVGADAPATEQETTTLLPTITRGDRKLARSRLEDLLSDNTGDAAAKAEAGRPRNGKARRLPRRTDQPQAKPGRRRAEKPVAGKEGATEEAASRTSVARKQATPKDEQAPRKVNGRKHRADEPGTGQWLVWEKLSGKHSTDDTADEASPAPAEVGDPPNTAPELPDLAPRDPALADLLTIDVIDPAPGGWRLQTALADLDKALGSIGPVPVPLELSAPVDLGDLGTGEPDGTVVIDIERDGRRFAGPRARTVMEAVAQRLEARLPSGVGQEFGPGDALLISGPGWYRTASTAWMREALPGLLDGFTAPVRLPSAQLRVAFHDQDGPVGEPTLLPLTAQAGPRHGAGNQARHETETRGEPRKPDAAADGSGSRIADLLADALQTYRAI